MHAATEDAIFKEDVQNHPKKVMTCRATTPLWNQHAAKMILRKDVEDGVMIDGKMEIDSSCGNQKRSIRPFLMTFFASVFMRLDRGHLLHPTGR